jgi:hypothetical protein
MFSNEPTSSSFFLKFVVAFKIRCIQIGRKLLASIIALGGKHISMWVFGILHQRKGVGTR